MHPISLRSFVLSAFVFSAGCGILPEGDPSGTEAANPNAALTNGGGGSTGGTSGAVTYAANIAPLIAANCVTCHGAGGSGQGFFDCTTQANVTTAADSINTAVTSNQMPPAPASPLSDADKKTIADWIADGKN